MGHVKEKDFAKRTWVVRRKAVHTLFGLHMYYASALTGIHASRVRNHNYLFTFRRGVPVQNPVLKYHKIVSSSSF